MPLPTCILSQLHTAAHHLVLSLQSFDTLSGCDALRGDGFGVAYVTKKYSTNDPRNGKESQWHDGIVALLLLHGRYCGAAGEPQG